MEKIPVGALTITNRPSAPVVAVTGVPSTMTLAPSSGSPVERSVTFPVIRARRTDSVGIGSWAWRVLVTAIAHMGALIIRTRRTQRRT
jgi:hypothetical protein